MKKKRYLSGLLIIVLLGATILYGWNFDAKATSIDDLKRQQEEAEQDIGELEQAKQELEDSLGNMNSELYDVSSSINDLQEEIEQKQEEIAQVEEELEEAEALAAQQYEDMKLRIQFMYENGGGFSWSTLLEAGSFADFLSRVQYISELTGYDRDMLAAYQENLEAIASYKETLEQENENLLAAQESLALQESSLLASIADAQEELDDMGDDLTEQQQDADELAEQIAAMEAYEKQLEEQKAREDAARAEEIQRQEEESAGTSGTPVAPAVGEEELLAALIFCEAGGESYDAQLAVGSVVLNRVNSPYFADTITGVIYQSGQFSPAASGRLAVVLEKGLTTDNCRNAAREVLNGNVTGNWLYFCVNNGTKDGTVIGKQVFY